MHHTAAACSIIIASAAYYITTVCAAACSITLVSEAAADAVVSEAECEDEEEGKESPGHDRSQPLGPARAEGDAQKVDIYALGILYNPPPPSYLWSGMGRGETLFCLHLAPLFFFIFPFLPLPIICFGKEIKENQFTLVI